MKHAPFADEFNIGSTQVAKIRLGICQDIMRKASADILTTSYINDEWLAMRARQYRGARVMYDRAVAYLAGAH